MDATTRPPAPINEPPLSYAPGSPERDALVAELARLEGEQLELTATIGGVQRPGGGAEIPVVQPHDHQHVLGVMRGATQQDAREAVAAAQEAEKRAEAARDALAEVEEAARRGARLVKRLLQFSKGQLTRPEVLDPNAVIESLDGLLRGSLGSHVQLRYALDPEAGSIAAGIGFAIASNTVTRVASGLIAREQ
jgi:signal transduction histidine kinase